MLKGINECIHIFNHSLNVADKAIELANIFKVDSVVVYNVYIAALLHDIGGIYPNDQRISIAKQYGIELLDEEYTFPLIIHQKISRYLAETYFEIKDINILDSIECHTTLKEHYRIEDLIVFLADKIAWDQKGNPPYLDNLLTKLQSSLEEAVEAKELPIVETVNKEDVLVLKEIIQGIEDIEVELGSEINLKDKVIVNEDYVKSVELDDSQVNSIELKPLRD